MWAQIPIDQPLRAELMLLDLVRAATKKKRRVRRGAVSQGDFATMWLRARALGIVQRDSSTPSAPVEMQYMFDDTWILIQASPWCPDGEAGVA